MQRVVQEGPRASDVRLGRVQIADGQAQGVPPVQAGVGDEHFAGFVHRIQQPLVQIVASLRAEADDTEGDRRGPLEVVAVVDAIGKAPREAAT